MGRSKARGQPRDQARDVPAGTASLGMHPAQSLDPTFLPEDFQSQWCSSEVNNDQVTPGHTSSLACAFSIFPDLESRSVGSREAYLSMRIAPTLALCFSE